MTSRALPLLVRPGATYACFGDGLCCSDAHVLGPVSREEAARVRSVDPAAVGRHAGLRIAELRTRDRACVFYDGSCSLHRMHGAAFKPAPCRRFPFGLVRTPVGLRVTTAHRCPCRSMGERPALDVEDARRSLSDRAGRLSVDREVNRVRLAGARRVSFARYAAVEAPLLSALAGGALPEDVLDAEPLPPLDGASWSDVAHRLRGYVDGTSCGEGLAWAGDALLALGGQRRGALPRARPWAAAFERAEARSVPSDPEALLRDWVADVLWELGWTEDTTFALARAELATRLAMARWAMARMVESGTRPDRAAAEAVLVVELAGQSPLWPAVLRTMT